MGGVRISTQGKTKLAAVGALLLGAVLVGPNVDRADAADRRSSGGGVFVSEANDVQRVKVTVNKSRTFRVETPFSTIVAGSTDIVDVKSLSDHLIYIQGKQPGTTNVILLDSSMKQIGILDVEVTIDIGNLQQNIQTSTGIRGIRVTASEGQVIVGGTAPDSVAAQRAMEIAQSTVPKGSVVVNAMNVTGPQQVMLEVRFLEVNRSAGRELGMNLYGANANGTNIGNTGLGSINTNSGRIGMPNTGPPQGSIPLLGTAGTLAATVTGAPAAPFGSLLTSILRTSSGASVDLLVTALENKGLVRRLAEPNLMALSGESARFLAGGEFPVPVASSPAVAGSLATVSIQFKTFGVELGFIPTVLSRGVINLRVEPSVSELDFTNAVTISGTTIPALSSRNARTTVELRDGQSFAIAGLLQTRNRQDISQLPWIGSVPVLGTLFRSSSYQQQETDLVIIVTPRLVAPAAPGQQLASPLDSRMPANDVDFFLNGQMEVKKRYNDYVSSGGELKGPYGHIIAPDARVPAPPPVVVTDQPVVKTLN
ncbi:type II and III secretion system protein family protein [Bradyrhizobium sp. CB1717]|uniref:type II and III secretion system protein family protein n=1 Tax=Bradyrhizobium sp. CB1717 TaxID=3039154 RepID=UPI0024B27F14|nr:type II and III secretion system protein family protein [Bradyrhizobium sp. CB1717]WFU22276.1 type II and III secretion system protein family protein [Bradyrhizobium sp. CB1717]